MSKTFSYRLHQLLDNDDQDEKLLYDRVKDLLGQYEQDDELHDGTASIGELYRNFIERTGEFDQSQAITCDFEELDEQRVFQKGEFVVIGGRPAMGKSQLMINIAMNMSVRVPVLYISFDQSKLSLTRRMISSLTELDFSRIRQGHLNELQLKLVNC